MKGTKPEEKEKIDLKHLIIKANQRVETTSHQRVNQKRKNLSKISKRVKTLHEKKKRMLKNLRVPCHMLVQRMSKTKKMKILRKNWR